MNVKHDGFTFVNAGQRPRATSLSCGDSHWRRAQGPFVNVSDADNGIHFKGPSLAALLGHYQNGAFALGRCRNSKGSFNRHAQQQFTVVIGKPAEDLVTAMRNAVDGARRNNLGSFSSHDGKNLAASTHGKQTDA